jgi:hypothetical protein
MRLSLWIAGDIHAETPSRDDQGIPGISKVIHAETPSRPTLKR